MQNYVNNNTLDLLSQQKIVAKHFYKFILDSRYTDSSIDDSFVSDFSGNGLTEKMFYEIEEQYNIIDKKKLLYTDSKDLYYKIKYQYWKQYLKTQILMQYKVYLDKINTPFIDLIDTILKCNNIESLQNELENTAFSNKFCCHAQNNFPVYSNVEIHNILKKTTNPYAYSYYSMISLDEAKKIVEKRQHVDHLIYKPYRPTVKSN